MIQIISITLQLSGAVILLLWCLKGAGKEQIIRKYFPGSNIVTPDDDGNCVLEKKKLQEVAKDIYVNIVAFIDLIIGYLITYFITDTYSSVSSVVITVILSIIVIILEQFLSQKIAELKYPEDVIIKYKELEKHNVDAIASNKEVNEMLEEMFGK